MNEPQNNEFLPRNHEQTMQILLNRASCRSFQDRQIPEDVETAILNAGIHAPTGGNLQPWSIINIKSEINRQKLAEMCHQPFMAKAPLHLLFCIDFHRLRRWAELKFAPFSATHAFRHFWISFQDTIIAAQNICTAADASSLGSVYIGTILEHLEESRKMFMLPKGVLPVVLLCLGYPKIYPQPAKKLGIPVMVHDETYRDLPDEELLAAFDEKYSRLREITDERLELFREVCSQVHGDEFAEQAINSVKKQNGFNAAQMYFGLHYVAHYMPQGNEDFKQQIRDAGFGWFDRFLPQT